MSWRIMFEGFSCGERREADEGPKKDPVLKPAENSRVPPTEQPSSISLPLKVECAFSQEPKQTSEPHLSV